jgi:hypothetical protein
MKIFIKKVFFFILPLLLFAYGLDFFLSGVLKKSNSFADGEYPVWNDLYEGKINSDIVIYGTSRALVHIDPGMISSKLHTTAYNLGINGHSFKTQYFRHSLLLKFNKKPKIIIQTLDVTSFVKSNDLYNPDQYLPYMLNNEDMKLSIYSEYSSLDYKLPVIRYYGKKEAFIEVLKLLAIPSSNKVVRIKGYKSKDLKWNNDLMIAQQELGSLKVKSDSSMVLSFEKYLNECSKLNIKVIFVCTPVYIEGQQFVANWTEIMNLYHRLSQKFDIPFFDYSNDSLSLHKEYFYNSGHLNRTGAELLTAKLIDDISKSRILTASNSEIQP